MNQLANFDYCTRALPLITVVSALSTAEKLNERPSLDELSSKIRKGVLIQKFVMSAEALIQIVCKNDEARVFFSLIFFVFYKKEIYKHDDS